MESQLQKVATQKNICDYRLTKHAGSLSAFRITNPNIVNQKPIFQHLQINAKTLPENGTGS